MKIVFITIAAPFSRKETYIVEELRNICRLKCEVFIFPLTKSTKEITASNKISALSYRACFSKNFKALIGQLIRKPFRIFYSFLHLAIIQKPKRFFYTLYILPKILQLTDWIEKEQIDHIHAYWGTTPATCAMIASELTQVPFSFTIHRADIISNDILAYKSERALFVRSISNWGKELAIKLGADQDKIKIIHFGVNIPRILLIKKRTKEINIVCVGELIRHKRIYELIERIAKLKKINLFIFGDGREKSRIKRMIRRSNLSGNIKLLGTVTPKMLFGFYESRKFDLFILPSKIEGIPVAAMEAMAYSIPVAITKVGGSGELINNQNGYVLKQDFSNLEKILNKCPEPEKITKAYLRVKEEFNVNKTSLKLFNTIKKYAKKNKKTIWIINQYAVSPQLPGGTRHYDFAKELTRKNLNIIIFTSGFNNFDKKESLKYDNGGVFPEQVGKSLKFIWIKTPRYRKNNILRVRNIFIFAKNLRKIISDFIKPDLIIGSSPNLIASYQAYKIARFMKVPFIFEVRDIWPQNLIELGANKLNPFIIYLRYIEKILMIKSDRIVSLMPYFANYAQKKFKVSSKKYHGFQTESPKNSLKSKGLPME
ncbi:MAG: glycosyltransferase [bacterium]